ncbi:hypothetical protein [Maritalea sp.]|uniref:hypothetical protein n=1 Tax=Maritalea sp. TaxID=2003361 RepID=UPI003EF7B3B3
MGEGSKLVLTLSKAYRTVDAEPFVPHPELVGPHPEPVDPHPEPVEGWTPTLRSPALVVRQAHHEGSGEGKRQSTAIYGKLKFIMDPRVEPEGDEGERRR